MVEGVPSHPSALKQITAFAVVHFLVKRCLPERSSSMQDFIYLQRLQAAVAYVADDATLGLLTCADKRTARAWKDELESNQEQVTKVGHIKTHRGWHNADLFHCVITS